MATGGAVFIAGEGRRAGRLVGWSAGVRGVCVCAITCCRRRRAATGLQHHVEPADGQRGEPRLGRGVPPCSPRQTRALRLLKQLASGDGWNGSGTANQIHHRAQPVRQHAWTLSTPSGLKSSFLHTRQQHVIQSTVSTGAPSRPHERGQCAAHRSEADLSPERAATRPRSCAGAGPTGPRPGTATKHPTGTRTSPEDGKRRARASLKFTRVVLPCTSLAEFTYFCRDYNIMHIIKR